MGLKTNNTWLTGLAIYCPLGIRVNSCPFMDMESMPFPGKMELLEKMEKHEKNKIITHHEDCLKKRELSWT
jgi:hypothetical protein